MQMKNSILIVEDDTIQSKALEQMLRNYHIQFDITIAHTIDETKNIIDTTGNFCAFIIDISLNQNENNTDGLLLTDYILNEKNYRQTPIIFTTAYPQYIFTALNDFHCYSYLLKPFNECQLHKQLDMIFKKESVLKIKTLKSVHIKINIDDIYYIQSFGRIIEFITKDNKITSRQYNMKKLEEILPDNFKRCHKSYIINTDYVYSVNFSNRLLTLKDNNSIVPFSKNFDCSTL